MADTDYNYTKSPVAVDRLEQEIRSSAILTALNHATTLGTALTVTMRDVLSSGDQAALDALVSAHTGVPLVFAPPSQPVTFSVPTDSDGSQLVRTKTTKSGWHFEPRSLDYWTGVAKSLYNRKYNAATILGGDDIADGTMKFYDATGALMLQAGGEADAAFQARLDDPTTGCVETMMDWEPTYDYDIIGAYIQMVNVPPPTSPAYMWVIIAPDIPSYLGGSVPFCNGGWNLSFFRANDLFDVDGHGVKSMIYSATYHTSKIRVLVKHAPAAKIGVQIIYKQYKA